MDAHAHPEGHAHGHAGDTADALTSRAARDSDRASNNEKDTESSIDSIAAYKDSSEELPAGAQILGVAMLEFGVIFHSITIGLTLALTEPSEVSCDWTMRRRRARREPKLTVYCVLVPCCLSL